MSAYSIPVLIGQLLVMSRWRRRHIVLLWHVELLHDPLVRILQICSFESVSQVRNLK